MVDLLDKMIPPDDPRALNKWRWFVAIGVILSLCGNVALFAYLIGAPGAGQGFATMEEFAILKEEQKQIFLDNLTARINNTRVTQCEAVIEGNQIAMTFTYNRLQMLLNDFRARAGYDYYVPDCRELVPEIRSTVPTPTPTPVTPVGK